MQISGLFIYPVKSLRGISLHCSEVDLRGLKWDRHWMVVDENGRFYSQRDVPRMALVSTAIAGESLTLSAEGYGSVDIPLTARCGAIEGAVWSWRGTVDLVDPEVDSWLTEVLERPSRLAAMRSDVRRAAWNGEVAFPDGAPVLVLGDASYQDLLGKLAQPVPMDRFRANVIVQGTMPYAEDTWSNLGAGSAELLYAGRCARCVMTTVDQRTGERPQREEPLKTLVRERLIDGKACFGANYTVGTTGKISVGDIVKVDIRS